MHTVPMQVERLEAQQQYFSYRAILAWWTFRPRKKIFSPPPPNSPIRRRHPPSPSHSWKTPPPPSWDFQSKTDPLPPSWRLGLPLPPPRAGKIKISETSTKLVAIVSQNSFGLVFMGYRTVIARYVAKWGIAQMCLCKAKYQGGVSHHFGGVLASLIKYRAIWGIAAIVSQYRAIWGH